MSRPRRLSAALAAVAITGAALGAGCGGDDTTTSAATTTAPPTTATSAPSTTAPSTPTSVHAPDALPPTSPSTTSTTTSPATSLAGRVIAIDPGHNGANVRHTAEINRTVDAGGFSKACNTTGTATNDGYSESAFNWAVATVLAENLRALGASVVLTRDDDAGWGPCIDERGRIAADAGADALISIHADGADAGAHGFHVIRPGAVAGYTDGIVEPSSALATAVRDAMVAGGLSTATYVDGEGIVERTDLGTLNNARVPAVMLEAGNMRNAAEAAVLRSPAGQEQIAAALTAALVTFLSG